MTCVHCIEKFIAWCMSVFSILSSSLHKRSLLSPPTSIQAQAIVINQLKFIVVSGRNKWEWPWFFWFECKTRTDKCPFHNLCKSVQWEMLLRLNNKELKYLKERRGLRVINETYCPKIMFIRITVPYTHFAYKFQLQKMLQQTTSKLKRNSRYQVSSLNYSEKSTF